jgi:hypothetical protein
MWILRPTLADPYTFAVMTIVILILGCTSVVTMLVDIFCIDVFVITVLWV